MKKLTTFAASIFVGFGLVSCDGDKTAEKDSSDKDAPAKSGESMETVAVNVTGMT